MRSFTSLVLCLALAACSNRSVSWDDGATVGDGPAPLVDLGPALDRSRPVDVALARDASSCGQELQMGLVSTFFDGEPSTTLVKTLPGHVIYHGKITKPLASSPLFDREIQLEPQPPYGKTVYIQYYLPPGLTLPLKPSNIMEYAFTMKRRMVGNKAMTDALIIKGNFPGPWPFVLIAEPATYGQALDVSPLLTPLKVDDPLISPLTVSLLERNDCPVTTSSTCAPRYIDRLRFEATTGAGLIAAELQQGEIIGLTLFGQKARLANLSSYHQRPACPGGVTERLSFVVVTGQ